ncbi:hypothetical protein BG003_005205 [Podila horticola]|nr:hypothetical protein BG003_005205 [Podila horticola]
MGEVKVKVKDKDRNKIIKVEVVSSFDTESQEEDDDDEENGGDLSNGRRTSGIFTTGRWRWGPGGSSSQMLTRGIGPGLAIVPEMDPPPMYQNEPGLPTYNPDDIGMTRIPGAQEGPTAVTTPQPLDTPGHERIPERLEGNPTSVVIPIDDHTANTSTSATVASIAPMNNILPEATHLPMLPSLQPVTTQNNSDNQTPIISEPETAHLSTKDK